MPVDKQAALDVLERSGADNTSLVAFFLNAFAKRESNVELTDVEADIVETFRRNGFTDVEIREAGAFFRDLSVDDKTKLFSGKFASMDTSSRFTARELEADFPGLAVGRRRRPPPQPGHGGPHPTFIV